MILNILIDILGIILPIAFAFAKKGIQMKTIVLTCNTGQGHNSVSQAIEESFRLLGHSCDTVDALAFISDKASDLIGNWHSRIYRYFPNVFTAGYKLCETHPKFFEEGSVIRSFLVSGSKRLYKYISEGGYDCIICPHVFSALMITQLRRNHPEFRIKTGFIATDYAFYPVTEELDCDEYFIPDSALIESYVMGGIPGDKLRVVTGIPVRRSFYTRLPKAEAKEKLGISSGCRHIMMMFGSMGCGPMPKLIGELGKRLPWDVRLTVVCGTNEKLKKALDKSYQGSNNIKIEGYVKDISLLMDSCDLYLTKPGGLSTSEARIKRLPMVLMNTVSGCEQGNLEFFIEKGAAVASDTEEGIAELCAELIMDDDRLSKMSTVFADGGISADEIVGIMMG